MGLIIAAQISVQVLFGVINTRTLEKMGNSLRNTMFKKLLKSDWAAFSEYHSGDVVTRMTSDASTVTSGMTWLVPELVAMFVQLIAAFVVLYSFDRVLALLAFMLGPILVLFSRLFTHKLRALHIKCQEGESKTRSFMQEALQNLLTVKAFNLEDQYTEHMKELQKDRLSWVIKRSWTGVASSAGAVARLLDGIFSCISLGFL